MNKGMLAAMMGASALGAWTWLNRHRWLDGGRPRVKQELERWEDEGGSPTAVKYPSAVRSATETGSHLGADLSADSSPHSSPGTRSAP